MFGSSLYYNHALGVPVEGLPALPSDSVLFIRVVLGLPHLYLAFGVPFECVLQKAG